MTTTNTITVTTFERFVLNCLARNCYTGANYSRPDSFEEAGSTWTHSILDADTTDCPKPNGFTAKSLAGVVASLVKKGLAVTDDETTGLTELGFTLWQALFPADDAVVKATADRAEAFADFAQFRTGKFTKSEAYLEKLREEVAGYVEAIDHELRMRQLDAGDL